jgi:hypothetical protein
MTCSEKFKQHSPCWVNVLAEGGEDFRHGKLHHGSWKVIKGRLYAE